MDFEEIPYPVKMYRNRLKEEHARNTEEAFDELVRKSGVDVEANAVLTADIRKRQAEIDSINSILGWWLLLRFFLIVLFLISLAAVVLYIFQICGNPLIDFQIPHLWACGAFTAGLLFLWLLIFPLRRKIKLYREQIAEKQNELKEKISQAWDQMKSLNVLFQWDSIAKIVMKTLPIIKIDQYFSNDRMENLCRHFQWNPPVDDSHSVINCQSGTMNGNPWILEEILKQYWGTEIYTGSITISWKEKVTSIDSNGKICSRWETRYQTLTASVEKPKPFYQSEKYLVYGNEAAPDLIFRREPNSLSSSEHGFFSGGDLKKAIRALEKKSRDLNDPFTIMDNREFDACFHALNRNNELQFRVLFTPLAQQEMLTLLRDDEQGFGDDFVFRKNKKINILSSDHLSAFDFSGSPDRFRKYDFSEIKKIFLAYSNDFFRNFYFSMAPLLCIPLYQEYRNYRDIYNGIIDSGDPSFFEYESFSNAMDQKLFKPAGAATPSILKTRIDGKESSAVKLSVSAHAFREENRTDHVSVYGRDGHWHDVPVHWIEYLPVTRKISMAVCETGTSDPQKFEQLSRSDAWRKMFSSWNAVPETLCFRRNLAAFICKDAP